MTRPTIAPLALALTLVLVFAGCARNQSPPAAPADDVAATDGVLPLGEPTVTVVADGLFGPIGMAAMADGGLLVAEEGTGERDDSAGVSLIAPDGTIGRFLSGLPSTRDAGDLAGVPLVALSPDGATLYVGNFGQGHLWTYTLSADEQANGLALPATPLTPDDLGTAMARLNNVMLINPFDMTFDAAGVPVVADASGNGIAKENADGTTRFIHRFDQLPNPVTPSDTIEAVPTGIATVGDEYWVTLTGGCPYPEGSGYLVAIDEARDQRTVLEGLNMPIDVAVGPDGVVWVLEFARFTADANCFSGKGYQTETGRLSRLLPDGTLETVLDHLNFPGAVLPMADGSLYITEVLPGRVLHVTFGDDTSGNTTPDNDTGQGVNAPAVDASAPAASVAAAGMSTTDMHAALRAVIHAQGLTPYPGADQREDDSPAAQLGQLLFFDPILSGDKNIACATCHHPAFAMADGRVLPIGTGGVGLGPTRVFTDTVLLADEAGTVRRLAVSGNDDAVHNPFVGQFVPRNSPTIINSALLAQQFWDGRVQSYSAAGGVAAVKTKERTVNDLAMTDPLAVQALFPVASLHEMAGATFGGLAPQNIRTHLLARLQGIPGYVTQFQTAFGTPDETPEEAVTLSRLVEALAAFERRFIFTDAPWDRYLAGDDAALTDAQLQGALLFFGARDPAVNCAQCHIGDLFTDGAFHNILAPQLGPGKGHGYTRREDWGRAGVTFDARDRYAFRTPSLRNVTLTAPYFHSGAYATLEDAVRHHAAPVDAALAYDPSAFGVPPDLFSSLQPVNPARQTLTLAPALQEGMPLSDDDVAALVAFLGALTDPAASELDAFIPADVPSALPLDPLPTAKPMPVASASHVRAAAEPVAVAAGAPVAPATAQAYFVDDAHAVGLDFRHGAFRDAIYADAVAAMGAGLCWLDFDGDGWLDLYVVNSWAEDEKALWAADGGLPRNGLFRNVGGTFTDVGAGSGADLAMRGNGCMAADFDGDGFTDLYVTAYGPNALLWNQGDGTFVDGAAAAGVDAPEWSSAAVAGDLNGDGLLDLFVGGYIDFAKKIPKPSGAFPQDYYGIPDRLFLNLGLDETGRAHFREVTTAAGLLREERALGALLSDLDEDGDLDLYIANDGHPNRLYVNEPDPGTPLGFRLVDWTAQADVGDSGSGMGVAGGDYDGDGLTDLFITNWERELNALYRNLLDEAGELTFQYSTFRIGISGLGNGITGWGTHLADFDHDTDTDLLIVNGRVPVTNLETDPELVRFYRNRTVEPGAPDGRPGHFFDWTGQAGLKELGPLLGRGSAAADFDNDGDLDVAINQIAGDVVLLTNNAADHAHWLVVDPGAVVPGLRAVVTLPDGRELVREVHVGSSYLAGEDPRLHFGLGVTTVVPQLELIWPDGGREVMTDVAADQVLGVK